MYKYQIDFPKYKLRDYEKELAKREFENQFPFIKDKSITEKGIEFTTNNLLDEVKLKKLTFFSEFHYKNAQFEKSNILTNQSFIENYKNYKPNLFNELKPNKSRDIRYLTHSLHEYKGRFYPQLAKSLMNYAGIKKGDLVLDPFCGSGTTLVESLLFGANAVGVDINPIAYLLAKAKIKSIFLDERDLFEIKKAIKNIQDNSGWKRLGLKIMETFLIQNIYKNGFPKII